MTMTLNLGFPRIGRKRELKKAVEGYWSGAVSETELEQRARQLRQQNWRLQQDLGIDSIPSNDFSFYDQVLDATAMVGAVPHRFGAPEGEVSLDMYFAMARGASRPEGDVHAMEMTKWFDTNYHYIVPELAADQQFRFASRKPVREFREAKELGLLTRPVLLGPVSYLLLAKCVARPFDRLSLLDQLLPVFEEVLQALAAEGAMWVQFDEPTLVLDLADEQRRMFQLAYQRLASAAPNLSLLVATYFGRLDDNLPTTCSLPVAGLHVDLVQGAGQLDAVLKALPPHMLLSLGVIDGRNVWRADLDSAIGLVRKAMDLLGDERVIVAPACSLLHTPIDLDQETELDPEVRQWLAFAVQKLKEVSLVGEAVASGVDSVAGELQASREALAVRRRSPRVHSKAVESRMADVSGDMARRQSPYFQRQAVQRSRLNLPLLPTTTIGSFPQTREVRTARSDYKAGRMSQAEYEGFLKTQIADAIRFQEEIGLDVLVHGEAERNDMVEYFGEQLSGFIFTKHGWVQSYGSRCVKPPIIYGDVSRPEPMTVRWIQYAQSLTSKPVKGMLTGPITILQWSFVRNDQPRSETCRQIALAIRDEVADLEGAGISIIQIDEAALREGLPLRFGERAEYLGGAVECFRLASCVVRDETQIHTHMCYSEFNDILESIAQMDADVISIESSRSRMELLRAFDKFDYPNEVGPGVYDIHSPLVPSSAEMAELLRTALGVLAVDQLWVNPDCGLKTRGWPEVRESLRNMVTATHELRAEAVAVGSK